MTAFYSSQSNLFSKLFFTLLFSAGCFIGFTQNAGIGTTTPLNKLTVQTTTNEFGFTHTDGTVTVGSYIGNFTGATGGWLGTKTNHPLNFFTFNGAAQMTIVPGGNVGIGTVNPTNKLQINGATPGFTGYDFAIGRNAQVMAIYQGPNFTNLVSTANFTINPNNGNGYVGINVGINPTNKLQIGSVESTGFATNDLAIGNGTNAMAIYQTNASTLIGSSTDIVLKPRNSGSGRVGIITNTPRAPLNITDNTIIGGNVYSYLNRDAGAYGLGYCGSFCNAVVSIYASNAVLASEFDAFSDARIKEVIGKSNTANDLITIDAIQITDYTMKDKVKYGNKTFKKVIAQEIEKVYPQVISKHTDFIPNVYQVTSKIEKPKDGYLLNFSGNHNISKNAKKLRVLLFETEGMQAYDIVSLPSANQVVVSAPDIKTDKTFVYGEEVGDFRTVDYEGLTTLNISATQELSKLLKKQQVAIDEQSKKIAELTEVIKLLNDKEHMVQQ